jgi:hypothetical protein
MALKRKHIERNKNRKQRKRLKKTTGELQFVDVIYMQRERDENGDMQLVAVCTCEKWHSSPEATTIMKVAMEAKAHAESGPCILRPHNPEDVLPYKDVVPKEDLDEVQDEDTGHVPEGTPAAEDPEAQGSTSDGDQERPGEEGQLDADEQREDGEPEAGLQGGDGPGEDRSEEDGRVQQQGSGGDSPGDA